MSSTQVPEIIVAGGGVAGAAAAIFLSRLRANVAILESRSSRLASAEGGALMLGPNGMNVLNGIHLAGAILERESSAKMAAMAMKDEAGGLIGRIPYGSEDRYGFASTMMMRSDLHDVLMNEVEKRQIQVNWGAQVQSIDEFDDGVCVRWLQDGVTHERKVDLLIGADGIWSTVRSGMYKCLGMPIPKPEYSGLLGIGSLIDMDSVPGLSSFLTPDQSCVMVRGQRGFVGMAILGKARDKVGWWTTHEAPDRAREEWKIPKAQALSEMRERYSGWAFPVPQLIAAAEASTSELLIWPLSRVPKLERWHSTRTVLIGDAAHAMPPHSGQGASQALEDAAYLAYLVRKQLESAPSSVSGLDWASTLAEFQAARQDRVHEIVDEANRRGSQKKEYSFIGHLISKWIMWAVFLFARESWGDSWFGYKVPGIGEW